MRYHERLLILSNKFDQPVLASEITLFLNPSIVVPPAPSNIIIIGSNSCDSYILSKFFVLERQSTLLPEGRITTNMEAETYILCLTY